MAWTITETNDTPPRFFPAPLTAVHVDLSTDGGATTFVSVDPTTPGFTGDANGNQLLDVGEHWTWVVSTNPTANTTVTATGFGNGPAGPCRHLPGRRRGAGGGPGAGQPAAGAAGAPPPAPPPPSTPLLLPPTGGGTLLDASGTHRPGRRPDRRRPRPRHPPPAPDDAVIRHRRRNHSVTLGLHGPWAATRCAPKVRPSVRRPWEGM